MKEYRICKIGGMFKVQYKAWWTFRGWRDFRAIEETGGPAPLTTIIRWSSYKGALEFIKGKNKGLFWTGLVEEWYS